MKQVIAAVSFLILLGCSDSKKLKTESYSVGFRTIHAVDKSRVYKPGTDTTDYLHYRSMDIDLWYPAEASATGSVVLFRDLLGLLDKRANYYTASHAGDGLSRQIAQMFCEGFKCSDTTRLLNFKTGSWRDAPPVKGEFPLVIYLSAYNGMSYENFSLFEDLVRKGFVVVSISSIGRFPGDMTMKNEDMMEQVNDAIASFNELKLNSNIDFSKIGLVGYSWGGLSASILAGKIPNVACLISLDGSEFHHYGSSNEEDTDFESIRNGADFKNMRLSMPYLRLESSLLPDVLTEDSVYNFSEKLSSGVQILRIDSAQHEDFGCLSLVVKESGNCKNNHHFETISKLTSGFLEEHLKRRSAFSQIVAEEMGKIHRNQ